MPSRIEILHPGYEDLTTLFVLPARDGRDRDRAYLETTRAACLIITNNPASFWLSRSREEDAPRIEADGDGLIPAGEYYLHVPTEDNHPYPVVPNFRAWRFPHGAVPPQWHEASRNDNNTAREPGFTPAMLGSETCRILDKHLVVENAHVIPRSERPWFAGNNMARYATITSRSGSIVLDEPTNKMRLQIHAHRLWDGLQFSIVPRTVDGHTAYHTQMMVEDKELEEDWHIRRLQPLAGRAPEYLFARFAWDVFPRLIGFLDSLKPRYLTVCSPDTPTVTRLYSASECHRFTVGQGVGRSSASPTKRARSDTGANDDDVGLDEEGLSDGSGQWASEDSGVWGVARPKQEGLAALEDGTEWTIFDGEEGRGRKRRRSQERLWRLIR